MLLQQIRDKALGWFAWVLIAFLSVLFGMWGISNYLMPSRNGEVVARVGNQPITQGMVQAHLRRLSAHWQGMNPNQPLTEHIRTILAHQAKLQVIESAVTMRALKNAGFRVPRSELFAYVQSLPVFMENQRFSRALFTRILSQLGYSQADFLQDVEQEMLHNQFHWGIQASLWSNPDELQAWSEELAQSIRIKVQHVTQQSLKQPLPPPSEAELKAYYDKHRQEFVSQERMQIDYIHFDARQLPVRVSEQDIQEFYQAHPEQFQEPSHWVLSQLLIKDGESQAESVADKIKKGLSFVEAVHQYSADPLAKRNHGAMPPSQEAALPAAVREALQNKKVGDVIGPVKTHYGWQLFFVRGKSEAKGVPLSQVSARIRQLLIEKKRHSAMTVALDQLDNLSMEHPLTLTPLSQALKLPIQHSSWFTKASGSDSITRLPMVRERSFSQEILEGSNSAPLRLNEHEVLVFRLRHYEPAQAQAFAQVRSTVLSKVSAKYLESAIAQQAQAMMDQKTVQWPEKTISRLDHQHLPMVVVQKAFTLSERSPVAVAQETPLRYWVVRYIKAMPPTPPPKDAQQLVARAWISGWQSLLGSSILENWKVVAHLKQR